MPRSLTRYREMRDFGATPEPSGRGARAGERRAANDAGLFVVQKHAATRLHYDFRLEFDGVLLSWAVPREPSMSVGVRRLAVRTEDHPVEYAAFEGDIPEGHYGAGHVDIWDRGTWRPVGHPADGLKEGRLEFELAGGRLAGRFMLVRMKSGHDERREHWLLIRQRNRDEPAATARPPRASRTSRAAPGGAKRPASRRTDAARPRQARDESR